MARAVIRPPAPFFWRRSGGNAWLRGGEPEKLFGLCRAGCGIPRTNIDFWLFTWSSRDSGSIFGMTRVIVRVTAPSTRYILIKWLILSRVNPVQALLAAARPGNNPNNCSLSTQGLPGIDRDSGFGVRGFGVGVRDICIYLLIYIHFTPGCSLV